MGTRLLRKAAPLVTMDGARHEIADGGLFACDRTVETLMKGGSDPVITSAPEGAWTHVITDKAL